ncbi:hypothetical protein NLM16_31450 [Bradyrhizobium brasilense]|uniref:esterase/lipase family protein n=1 Tax=Bradyrhizobium brasilense TaxID=1419277 RepID=UPI00287725EB|nr:hypothetical protein [Bradyrhizobium brasilense]MCP3418635.1 hypothetical protein [Bradyrhizobium brasilense]
MESSSHVVILVHGIRDFALWQTTIRSTLEEAGFRTEATNYGRFNLLEFLAPIPLFRNRAIETVWNQIQIIKQNNEGASLSVIAHSFGTYVVANLMQQKFNVRFDRVIFCGSVVKYGFAFEHFQDRFSKPIVNEVGTRDIWPAMAESVTSGYGSAGTYGFNRPLVRDRWHNGASHGFFLDADFCKRYWVPFLRDGTVISGDIVPERPRRWIQFLSIVKIKRVVAVAAVLLLGIFVKSLYTPAKFTLQPGETRAFDLDLHRAGFVDVLINSIEPDWNGREKQKQDWLKAGRGDTPELWFQICSATEGDKCPQGVQKGINVQFSRELPSGPGTVVFVNFRDNPPITFSARINHP